MGHLLRQHKGAHGRPRLLQMGELCLEYQSSSPKWEHEAPREPLWWDQKENLGTSSDVPISFQNIDCFNSQSIRGIGSICSVSFYRWGVRKHIVKTDELGQRDFGSP